MGPALRHINPRDAGLFLAFGEFVKPCRYGHTAGRYANGYCKECSRRQCAAYRKAHSDKMRALSAAWKAANPERVRANSAAWYAANRERACAKSAAWHASNRQRACAKSAAWSRTNPERARARVNRRRALKFSQQCNCCADWQIQWFYDIQPKGYDVDHVVPLWLGGAHCTKNLQVLTKREHTEKTRRDHAAIAFSKRITRLFRDWRIGDSNHRT